MNNEHNWDYVIESEGSLFDLKLKDVWHYRDLLLMFVHRDFVTFYKQTILGPLWFIIQPLLTTLTFVVIFGNIAGISTDGVPKFAFYLAGVTIWAYFSETLTKTSSVFRDNASIFGKVYFPRLIMPLSIVVSGLIKFGVQFGIFIVFIAYYAFIEGSISPNWWVLAMPYLVFLMAILSLGLGMIISSMTTKYKDLVFLITFGIQLFMYATPVIYPISTLSAKFQLISTYNPLTAVFECFRYGFLGVGSFQPVMLLYSSIISFFILALGTLIFNKVEKDFMDSI